MWGGWKTLLVPDPNAPHPTSVDGTRRNICLTPVKRRSRLEGRVWTKKEAKKAQAEANKDQWTQALLSNEKITEPQKELLRNGALTALSVASLYKDVCGNGGEINNEEMVPQRSCNAKEWRPSPPIRRRPRILNVWNTVGGVKSITKELGSHHSYPEEEPISNLQKLKDSKWSKPAKHKNAAIDFDALSEEEVEELLKIHASATEFEGEVNPHKLFKKQIVNVIGKAGSDHKHWKNRGVTGMAAHRIYHQLFKIQKKKTK